MLNICITCIFVVVVVVVVWELTFFPYLKIR